MALFHETYFFQFTEKKLRQNCLKALLYSHAELSNELHVLILYDYKIVELLSLNHFVVFYQPNILTRNLRAKYLMLKPEKPNLTYYFAKRILLCYS